MAVAALGEQLRGEPMILFVDVDAAAGALIEASPRVSAALGSGGQ